MNSTSHALPHVSLAPPSLPEHRCHVELDEGLSMTYQQNRAVVIAGRMRSTFAAAMRALLRHPECVESIRDQVAHHLNHAYHVSTDFNRAIWESAYANDNGRHGNGKAKGSP